MRKVIPLVNSRERSQATLSPVAEPSRQQQAAEEVEVASGVAVQFLRQPPVVLLPPPAPVFVLQVLAVLQGEEGLLPVL